MVKNSNIKGKFTLENLARDNTELLKLARHNTWKLDYKYKNQITKGKVQMRKNNASNYNSAADLGIASFHMFNLLLSY